MDDKEVGSWIQEHEMLLYSVAWDWFRNKNIPHGYDDVQDAVALAMERIWKYKDRYAPVEGHPHPMESWASMIVRQSCYAVGREINVTTERYDYMAVPAATPAWTNSHPVDPEQRLIHREEIVWQWGHLNPQQRQVLYMRYLGYDEHEIGYEMGVTNIRVKSILSSGRRKAVSYRR